MLIGNKVGFAYQQNATLKAFKQIIFFIRKVHV